MMVLGVACMVSINSPAALGRTVCKSTKRNEFISSIPETGKQFNSISDVYKNYVSRIFHDCNSSTVKLIAVSVAIQFIDLIKRVNLFASFSTTI